MLREIAISVLSLVLIGCGGSAEYTGTYVAEHEAGVMQLNLVEAENGQINATLSASSLNYDEGKIETITGGMTGIRDGSTIGLLSSNGAGGSMTLKGDGDKVVWQVPDTGELVTFVEMDQAGYERKLVKLNNQLFANDVGLLPDSQAPLE